VTSPLAILLLWVCPQSVRCIAVSEHIPVLGPQFYSKLEGDPLVRATLEMELWSQVQLTRQVMMLVLRRTWPVRLSRTKWPRLVKRIWEPSLPAPVPCR
jgi:hypothetical protein